MLTRSRRPQEASSGSSSPTMSPVDGQAPSSNRAALDAMESGESAPKFGIDSSFEPDGYSAYYEENRARLEGMTPDLAGRGGSVDHVLDNWAENQARYQSISEIVDLPPELIAALHFRESSSDFDTYLHNGDPLGEKTRRVPAGIGPMDTWEESAEDVFGNNYRSGIQDDLGLTADSTDLAAIATYAELYNGTGYSQRGLASPYVFAGTSAQDLGMYVADGQFDPGKKDPRLGVVPIVQLLAGDINGQGVQQNAYVLGDRVLSEGERGADVSELQGLLNQSGATLTVDGVFGPATDAAVRTFQHVSGLAVDGLVGPSTLTLLQAGERRTTEEIPALGPSWEAIEAELSQEEESANNPTLTELMGTDVLRQGSRGEGVTVLQRALVDAGYSVTVDGIFGSGTRGVVMAFQRSCGLVADGLVGPKTAAAIEAGPAGREQDQEETSDIASLVAVMGTSLLSVGSRGAAVEALQQALVNSGYPLDVDGDFGPRTRQAVERFQEDRGLIVDGTVGPQTRSSLLA